MQKIADCDSDDTPGQCGVLLLAAGCGRRFGRDKRREVILHGETMLAVTLAAVREAGLACHVCLRQGDSDLFSTLTGPGVSAGFCLTAGEGMGATLAEGMTRISNWRAVIVALADMPWVTSTTYTTLAGATGSQNISVPVYQSKRGNPVAFGSAFFPDLRQCTGDRGARGLLSANSAQVAEIAVADPGILRDVDTISDLSET